MANKSQISLKILLILFFIALLTACTRSADNQQYQLKTLASKVCRAIGLRQERYQLADRIRFCQDTLNSTKSAAKKRALQNELSVFNTRKTALVKQSLTLADSIHTEMESLKLYSDKVNRADFDKILHKMMLAENLSN